MAKCAICEKGAHFGNNVSHSHRRSNKMWKSNIKSVKVKQQTVLQRNVCLYFLLKKRQSGESVKNEERPCPMRQGLFLSSSIFIQQQNRLYPTSMHSAASNTIRKLFGNIKARNSPTPIQNSKNPMSLCTVSLFLLLPVYFNICTKPP